MGAGITGTTLSNGLLTLRKRMDPEFESPNKPPNVLKNAGTWATHMGISSNLRYQAINGFDMVRHVCADDSTTAGHLLSCMPSGKRLPLGWCRSWCVVQQRAICPVV